MICLVAVGDRLLLGLQPSTPETRCLALRLLASRGLAQAVHSPGNKNTCYHGPIVLMTRAVLGLRDRDGCRVSSARVISIPNLRECYFYCSYLRLDILWIYFHVHQEDLM